MSGILDAVSFRDFWTEDQIKEVRIKEAQIKEAVARKVENRIKALYEHEYMADRSALRTLLIFSTSKQQTWLVADQFMLHCVLDDRRKEEPHVQWSMRRNDVEPLKANYEYSPSSGVLYFGDRAKGWLFSKNLFQAIDIIDAIRQLLASADR